MSQEKKQEESLSRSRITIELGELSSKQRGAVLGLIKDVGFAPAEISEVVVRLPEDIDSDQAAQGRRGKRK